MDRLDICVEAPKVAFESLVGAECPLSSEKMREMVKKARDLQLERFQGTKIRTNTQMSKEEIDKYCMLKEAGKRMLQQAYDRLHLTARTYFKILKVARTIADLANETCISEEHICEAISYRMIDDKYWGKGY